jgi:hypothetical protein
MGIRGPYAQCHRCSTTFSEIIIASATAQLTEEHQRDMSARGGEHTRAPKPRWQAEHRRPTLAQKLREFEAEHTVDQSQRLA